MERPSYFIDFEASGIAPSSYPISVAIVSCDTEFTALIRPAPYWDHWSYDAQDMHGLTRENLLKLGVAPQVLACELNQSYRGQALCSDSPQDVFWLETLYEAAGLEPSFQLRPLESFFGRAAAGEIYRLLPARRKHDALSDAKELLLATTAFLERNHVDH